MTEHPARRFLFLLSSARAGGNSEQLARHAASGCGAACDWLDLTTMSLPPFADPRPQPAQPPVGDLAEVLSRTMAATDLVFVAPVYWYALPAPAKLLLDHWSGFLDTPDLGFAPMIAARTLWLITTRADPNPAVAALPEAMMRHTADWLTMRWGGALHGVADLPGQIVQDESWQQALGFLRADGRNT